MCLLLHSKQLPDGAGAHNQWAWIEILECIALTFLGLESMFRLAQTGIAGSDPGPDRAQNDKKGHRFVAPPALDPRHPSIPPGDERLEPSPVQQDILSGEF